ncbi:hypothetical protein D3C77_267890 [compost metagenome]
MLNLPEVLRPRQAAVTTGWNQYLSSVGEHRVQLLMPVRHSSRNINPFLDPVNERISAQVNAYEQNRRLSIQQAAPSRFPMARRIPSLVAGSELSRILPAGCHGVRRVQGTDNAWTFTEQLRQNTDAYLGCLDIKLRIVRIDIRPSMRRQNQQPIFHIFRKGIQNCVRSSLYFADTFHG